MNVAEIRAFNAGVRTALDHARHVAEAIQSRAKRPIAEGFAAEGLMAFADEGVALLLPEPAEPNGQDHG